MIVVYPSVGGVSGNLSKTLANDSFKASRAVMVFTCRKRRFHRFHAFTPKEFS